MNGPRFPIYIPSKGRHESRLTARALDAMGVPYQMIVEEQEHAAYASVIDPKRLLILDPQYQRDYDPGDDLGDSKSKGSGAARNFGWDHSISEGHERHWMVDDNIRAFYRLNQNLKVPVSDGASFRAMEDFACRYTNVAMAGPNYFMFASRKSAMPPFLANTRIYSCNLIRNDVPFRWRCRYNEDTDLSLRMLKAGYCTILFNAFLQEKSPDPYDEGRQHGHRLQGRHPPQVQDDRRPSPGRGARRLEVSALASSRRLQPVQAEQAHSPPGPVYPPRPRQLRDEADHRRIKMTPQRILVTGGAGFLGSHLCETLLGQGHEVLCLDNYSTGRRSNIAALAMSHPRLEVIRHDVTQPLIVEVDQIYNLACPASPIHYQRDPVQTLKTCVHGSINMLGLAKRTGSRIFQASTSEVYGDPEVNPQPETYWGHVNPNGTRACYDEGKRAAEALFYDYHRQHGVAVRVARIFNTYGPNMRSDDGRVVSNFIVQALRGDDLTVYGDGSQTRSFCFVSDLVQGIVALMESDHTAPVNLGNPETFTMLELAKTVQRLTGSSSKIIHCPLPADDPRQRQPDIAVARSVLGWAPSVDLEEGLGRTIAYFTASQ